MKLLYGLAVIAVLAPSTSGASEEGNIRACIDAIDAYSGKNVDEFDVRYDGRILGFSTASWPGVACEVSMDTVFNLTIDGKQYVVDQFSGVEAKKTFEMLSAETDEAIAILESRISSLKRRIDKTEKDLKIPNADISASSAYIMEGILKATGN